MLSRIWLANIALAAAVFFVGIMSIEVWTEEKKWPLEISSDQKPFPWVEKRVKKQIIPPESDYEAVVSDNLFFVDRSEIMEQKPKKGPAAVAKVSSRQLKVLEQAFRLTHLYGVIIVGDDKAALITETPAGRPAGVNKKGVKRAKVGDTVGRFKVKEIKATGVLLTAGGHEWRVSLFDKDKPKKRAPLKKETGPIVIVGGSKMKSVLTDAKAVGKRPTPKPAVSKKETLPKAQNKKRTIPVPTDRSKTKKR